MKLLVSIDEHYISGGDYVYSTEGTTPYEAFWSEYSLVFDEVVVLARVRHDNSFVGRVEAVANGPQVCFCELPDFRGSFQYLTVRSRVLRRIREAIVEADAYLLRGPGVIGRLIAHELRKARQSYAVQVIGDPWEVFGRGGVGGPLRLLYKHWLTGEMKQICRNAAAVAYVTESTLQRRYPAANGAVVASWSDVRIGNRFASDSQIESRLARIAGLNGRSIILGFIGSLEQPYKGVDVLLKAVSICRNTNLDLQIRLAGDGRLLPSYMEIAEKLGLSSSVSFLGRLGAGAPITEFLDSIDLFVMPSLTEGLPRALVEAMARACPCIGSNVGGIPELLDSSEMVCPKDAVELAHKIMEKTSSPAELARMAKRNHEFAKRYSPEFMEGARLTFLRAVLGAVSPHALPRPSETALQGDR